LIFEKVILIDDAGWGDLILGVVIGALKPPDRRYMERRVPVSSFQPPNFENKKYLDDTVKIADEIVEVMQPDTETSFKVCSGYVLSGICRHLRERDSTWKTWKLQMNSKKRLNEDTYDGARRWEFQQKDQKTKDASGHF
jgi:hypothetical protein